jgi:hypothetical protein
MCAARLFTALNLLPVWTDELFTLQTVAKDAPAIVEAVRHDIHPPLYYLLAHMWPWHGIAGLRAFSAVWALAATAILWAFWRDRAPRLAFLFLASRRASCCMGGWRGHTQCRRRWRSWQWRCSSAGCASRARGAGRSRGDRRRIERLYSSCSARWPPAAPAGPDVLDCEEHVGRLAGKTTSAAEAEACAGRLRGDTLLDPYVPWQQAVLRAIGRPQTHFYRLTRCSAR